MLELDVLEVGGDLQHRLHVAEGRAEDQLVALAGHVAEHALGIGRLGNLLHEAGHDLVAELLLERLAGIVVRECPATVADRADIGKRDLERAAWRLRHRRRGRRRGRVVVVVVVPAGAVVVVVFSSLLHPERVASTASDPHPTSWTKDRFESRVMMAPVGEGCGTNVAAGEAAIIAASDRFPCAATVGRRRDAETRRMDAMPAPKPARFEANLVVVGAGTAGLVSAFFAAALKAKVTLVESGPMGGDCLNTGCVPSKALIRSARVVKEIERAASFGIRGAAGAVDFSAVMARVHEIIGAIAPHDSAARFRSLGVDVVHGRARLTSPWSVAITVDDGTTRVVSTRSVLIATGARPTLPKIPGLDDIGALTSETVWGLRELPRRLVVLGGGPIGCELAQAFARLGAAVTLVENAPRLLVREEPEAAAEVACALAADGVSVRTETSALRCERVGAVKRIVLRTSRSEGDLGDGGGEAVIEFDALLLAIGSTPRVDDLGLEELGIGLNAEKAIALNDFLQTRHRHILAAGDVAGPYQFTHTAAEQARVATLNALFGHLKRTRFDTDVVPWTTFCDPEVARVGVSEHEARERGVAFDVTRYDFSELDRAVIDGATRGFVKVVCARGSDRIVGVTIVGANASELLAEFVLAMKNGLGLKKILAAIHVYPTFSEANKSAATEWQLAHLPQRLLRWMARYHAWRR